MIDRCGMPKARRVLLRLFTGLPEEKGYGHGSPCLWCHAQKYEIRLKMEHMERMKIVSAGNRRSRRQGDELNIMPTRLAAQAGAVSLLRL